MPEFLRSLLHAEADANGLPADDIHVAERFSDPDGGEDAHIRWQGDPNQTPHLPARYTQFQIKTGDISPAKAAKEVLTKDGDLKGMVRAALEADAHYVLLCTTSLTAKKVQAVTDKIRESIRGVGLSVALERIHVWDADQLAAWTNNYPAIVARLKEQAQSKSTGPFRSWVQWADRTEHVLSPFIDDERLPKLKTRIVDVVGEAGTVVRVLGAAGVGKSRLVAESFCPSDDQGINDQEPLLYQFVLYADQSEVEETAICGAVRTLADTGARAIVVVDDCPQETHQRLVGMVTAPRSRLSLITIDNDEAYSASAHDSSTVRVDLAPPSVTEGIIDRRLPNLPSEDRRRLLLFSRGYPTIAVRVADTWAERKMVPYSTDMYFVEAFVTGRKDPEPDLVIRTALLIAAFGAVRHTPDHGEATDLAKWGRGITPADMNAALERLIDRGVVQRRGGLVVLQPRPVAMRLTERQWREWTSDQWIDLLAGEVDPHLKTNAARQLEWINDTDIANRVAEFILRRSGPLDGYHRLCQVGSASVLHYLAAVDAQLAVDYMGRALGDITDLRTVKGDIRRSLVETIERVAFPSDTFDEAASLMLRLAVSETEDGISNNATGQFAALFPLLGGATEADGSTRIDFLRDAVNTNDSRQRAVIVNALLAGAGTMGSWRMVGAETHGSRPALKSWVPATGKDAANYVTTCVELLARAATVDDEVGLEAKTRLGHELRGLVSFGLIDVVEKIVKQVHRATKGWSEAIEGLGHSIQFDTTRTAPDVPDRVRALIELLQPKTLSERIHDLVSNMPWDYPHGEDLDYDEQDRRQLATVYEIAAAALEQTPVLAAHLPQLCRGSQRWAGAFGEFLGARIDSPKDWLQRISTGIQNTPDESRNFDLLTGFLKGLSERDPDAVDAFKLHIAQSADLARALPTICSRLGLVDSDIALAIGALRAGFLPPWSLAHWALGNVLSSLPTNSLALLFDELRDHGTEGLFTTVELMGMLAHGNLQRLDGLRSQLTELAKCIVHADLPRPTTMIAHHTTTLFGWLLERGREDDDACSLALILSRGLANDEASRHAIDLIASLLPNLLSRFPEIAWPLIGQQVLKRTFAAWHVRNVLGGAISVHGDGSEKPILSLPADTLFAWCSAHPEEAPAYAAEILPFLSSDQADANEASLHPLFRHLLDQFGDREDVLEAARANMHSFGWVGSLTTYFARYLGPLATLHDHPIPRVARWAKRMGGQLEREIEQAKAHDDEDQAQSEV